MAESIRIRINFTSPLSLSRSLILTLNPSSLPHNLNHLPLTLPLPLTFLLRHQAPQQPQILEMFSLNFFTNVDLQQMFIVVVGRFGWLFCLF